MQFRAGEHPGVAAQPHQPAGDVGASSGGVRRQHREILRHLRTGQRRKRCPRCIPDRRRPGCGERQLTSSQYQEWFTPKPAASQPGGPDPAITQTEGILFYICWQWCKLYVSSLWRFRADVMPSPSTRGRYSTTCWPTPATRSRWWRSAPTVCTDVWATCWRSSCPSTTPVRATVPETERRVRQMNCTDIFHSAAILCLFF